MSQTLEIENATVSLSCFFLKRVCYVHMSLKHSSFAISLLKG